MRSKYVNCVATVVQKGDRFFVGKHPHIHNAQPGLHKGIEIKKKVYDIPKLSSCNFERQLLALYMEVVNLLLLFIEIL